MIIRLQRTIFCFQARGRSLRRSRRGATAVEFALIAPVMLAIIIGIIELSRAMWIKATMQFAVEETSRYAIVNTSATESSLETYAQTVLTNYGVSATGMTFSATIVASSYVDIQISYTYSALIPFVSIPDIAINSKSRLPLS